MTTADNVLRLRSLVPAGTVGMLTTVTPNGELHGRPITVVEVDDAGALVFLVDARAEWVNGIQADEAVNFGVGDDHDKEWISVAGTARVSENRAQLDRLWSSADELFLPDGRDSTSIRILTVSPSSADCWGSPSSRLRRLAGKVAGLVGRKPALDQPTRLDLG